MKAEYSCINSCIYEIDKRDLGVRQLLYHYNKHILPALCLHSRHLVESEMFLNKTAYGNMQLLEGPGINNWFS